MTEKEIKKYLCVEYNLSYVKIEANVIKLDKRELYKATCLREVREYSLYVASFGKNDNYYYDENDFCIKGKDLEDAFFNIIKPPRKYDKELERIGR